MPALVFSELTTMGVLVAAGTLVLGFIAAIMLDRVFTGKTLANARAQAASVIEQARDKAQTEAEKFRLGAEKSILERKEKFEDEMKTARDELHQSERHLTKREDLQDRREEHLTQRENTLDKRDTELATNEKQVKARDEELAQLIEEHKTRLLRMADMTPEQALQEVLNRVEQDCRQDVAKVSRRIIEEAETDAKEKACEITLMAVQRYASEHTSESTVRSVPIPSDEMKGRIIGREGRNIRAFEKVTGVDIIVDDTPGVIVVSCFDKVRQAIAVESLERLVADGRLHPARIEEVVNKVQGEVQEKIIKFGKEAVLEVNLRGVHPKIVEAMGKLNYRTSYGQNILKHSIEVAMISQIIAGQLGLNGKIARRCGFLHDIGKAMDQEMEGTHPALGMDFARQYGEKEPVLNAIGGHHADIPSTSYYTPIVMAADAVSSSRPGARRESLERYVQRLNELQDIATSYDGVTEAYAIQAGREVRVMLDAAKANDDEAHLIANKIAKRISEEMTFPGEIRVTVLRETRAIEIAR